MARTKTTGFALTNGAATDTVTDPATRRAHARDDAARTKARRERASRAARKAGLVHSVPVPAGRNRRPAPGFTPTGKAADLAAAYAEWEALM